MPTDYWNRPILQSLCRVKYLYRISALHSTQR